MVSVWLLVLWAGACGYPPSGRAVVLTSSCLPADTLSADRIVDLTRFLAGSGSLNGAIRDSMQLSRIEPSAVALEPAGPSCRLALQALNAFDVANGYPPPPRRRFYLYRLGPFWGVEDVTTRHLTVEDGYSSRHFLFFSAAWRYLSATLFPPYRTEQ